MKRIEKLPEAVYKATLILPLIKTYMLELGRTYVKTEQIRDLLMFSSVKRYYTLLTDNQLQEMLRNEAKLLFQQLSAEFPLLDIKFYGRWKALISYINKVISFLDVNRPLDELKDMTAFRIVIDSDYHSESELTMLCYKMLNKVIHYYLSKGYLLCKSDPVSDLLPLHSPLRKKLVIPAGNLIEDAFLYAVKNYIQFPKENGYQSLHVIFRHPITGFTFEIQIRTRYMDELAEEGYLEVLKKASITTEPFAEDASSIGYPEGSMEGIMEGYLDATLPDLEMIPADNLSHRSYKEKKYTNPIEYDASRIQLEGFYIGDDGEIHESKENSGFEKPKILFSFPEKKEE